jgi:hypothetical protein
LYAECEHENAHMFMRLWVLLRAGGLRGPGQDWSHAGRVCQLLVACLSPDVQEAARLELETLEQEPGYCTLLLVRGCERVRAASCARAPFVCVERFLPAPPLGAACVCAWAVGARNNKLGVAPRPLPPPLDAVGVHARACAHNVLHVTRATCTTGAGFPLPSGAAAGARPPANGHFLHQGLRGAAVGAARRWVRCDGGRKGALRAARWLPCLQVAMHELVLRSLGSAATF